MASQAFQGLINKPLDFGGSTFAPSGQMKGTPSEFSSTSPSFGAASGGPGVPFTPSAPRMPVPSTGGVGVGGAPRATGSGDEQGRGGDPNNPLTYLKAIAAHGDLNPKQREEYERLLREEQNRMRPTGIPTVPSAPAPVLPPAQTSVIRPPSGATAPVPSVSQGTQAGGMAFGAPTQQGIATQALQAKGIAMPTPTPTPTPTQPVQTTEANILEAFRGATNVQDIITLAQRYGLFGPAGQVAQRVLSKELTPTEEKISTPGQKRVQAATIPGEKQFQLAPQSIPSGTFGMQSFSGAPSPIIKQTLEGKATATPERILGLGEKDQATVKQALTEKVEGKSQLSTRDLIAGVASEASKQTINKLMDKYQKSGDMEKVQQLATIYSGVEQQLHFNNILQQAIFAIASGMGSPQASGVTAARLPMVQQAAGAQLETPLAPQTGIPQQQEGAPISYLPPRFPQEDQTQRNKPPIYPWMTGA